MNPSILDLVTILYVSLTVLNQHPFTLTFFYTIGIYKYEKAILLEIQVLLFLLLKSIEVVKGLHQPIPLLQNMVFQMVQID
jgi:hypothetical protein